MKHREVVVHAKRIDSHSRKLKKYGPHDKGRTCEVCGAELNTRNPGPRCIPHTHAVFVKYRSVAKQA